MVNICFYSAATFSQKLDQNLSTLRGFPASLETPYIAGCEIW